MSRESYAFPNISSSKVNVSFVLWRIVPLRSERATTPHNNQTNATHLFISIQQPQP